MRKANVLMFGAIGLFMILFLVFLPYFIVGMGQDNPPGTMFYVFPIAFIVFYVVICVILYWRAEDNISLTPEQGAQSVYDAPNGASVSNGVCPYCGKFIGMGMPPFCPWCGKGLTGRP